MPINHHQAVASLRALLRQHAPEDARELLRPKHEAGRPRVVSGSDITSDIVDRRWADLEAPDARVVLDDAESARSRTVYSRNIENYIGTIKVPVGIAGPVRVNGTHAQGDYYVPMATTEATLVASYSRGAQLITEAGGCAAVTTNEGISRAPGFAFHTLSEAGEFVSWALGVLPQLKRIADSTTRHGALKEMRVTLEGNHVYLIFDYTSGDAAGQNIVTIATQAICQYIAVNSPILPRHFFLEANHSGDKKASAQSFIAGRGRSVTAEVWIPESLMKTRLRASSEMMEHYWRMSAVGGVLSGTMGVQGHYANSLAAVYLACGQDVASVAESAVGVTRFERMNDGLYACVTLPNLVVGTVGGGTGLPTQRACLDILGLAGSGNANAFAEVCAAISLAGELSIVGALVAGEFAQAHQRLARGADTRAAQPPSSHAPPSREE